MAEVPARGAPGAGGYTTFGMTSGACGRREAVGGGEDPMSLAAAGGRRAWSRPKSYVSELVVHHPPPRIRKRGDWRKIGNRWIQCTRREEGWGVGGEIWTLTTWWWPYATGWSSRYLEKVSVIRATPQWVVCPGGPRVGQGGVGLFVGGGGPRNGGGSTVMLSTKRSAKTYSLFLKFDKRIDRGRRH